MNEIANLENGQAFDVPVLFILFNRPQHARHVLERLRQIKPAQLFVAIDGPRDGVADDIKNVELCLALLDEIDWPCNVAKLIRDRNLGCKLAVSQAIDWFFLQVEEGIILEDDCLPDITFFDFCRVLLDKYTHDDRVMHIGGCNLYKQNKWGTSSYFFTSIPHIWGWATWRRAWSKYDVNIAEYPNYIKSNEFKKRVLTAGSRRFWERTFEDVFVGRLNTWDFQWVFAVWVNGGLCITPNQNLISNIGFDNTATHTVIATDMANLKTFPILVEKIIFPTKIELNEEATKYAFSEFYQMPSWFSNKFMRLLGIIKSYIFE
ncbi:hypothetical protein [Spirosoma spitsbergense]|uniref:hypothetical protein n=1 Tax=Spirosoma spitsbergense TaxID=431554 RepID=UPI0003658760|nr:hypothetical protein [Spirosoma spitsbergense]